MRRAGNLVLIIGMIVAALIGCRRDGGSPPPQSDATPPAVVEPSHFIYHKAMRGETMASIAKWYSGSTNNARAIAEINPEMNPNKLKVGAIVLVPIGLATVHTEQPAFSTAPQGGSGGGESRKPPRKPSPDRAEPEADNPQGNAPPKSEEIFGPK